ncbi:MAG: type II toxin-antitoxin system VapC family toxin [Crocosphaera sp.]|nr:type II toxin-antitoxin system VapC family toxin [Crocosphaera sp.]
MKFLLDTNICIYIIKQKPLAVWQRFQRLPPQEIGISSITVAELKYGVYKSQYPQKNEAALNQFLSPLQIVTFDAVTADCYGKIRADLERKGQVIGTMDMLIAAHALANDVIIVTNNTQEFSRIPSLKLENWLN